MTAKTAKSALLGWSGMFRGFSTGPTTRNVGLKGLCPVRCRIGRPEMVVSRLRMIRP